MEIWEILILIQEEGTTRTTLPVKIPGSTATLLGFWKEIHSSRGACCPEGDLHSTPSASSSTKCTRHNMYRGTPNKSKFVHSGTGRDIMRTLDKNQRSGVGDSRTQKTLPGTRSCKQIEGPRQGPGGLRHRATTADTCNAWRVARPSTASKLLIASTSITTTTTASTAVLL